MFNIGQENNKYTIVYICSDSIDFASKFAYANHFLKSWLNKPNFVYEYLREIHAVFEHALKSPSEVQGGLGLGEIIGPNLLTLSFKF